MISVLVAILFTTIASVYGSECACATGDVNVRSGAGTDHNILGILFTGNCVNFTGHLLSSEGFHWASVMFQGKHGWVANKWLKFTPQCLRATTTANAMTTASMHQLNNGNTTGCPQIITRAEWSARKPSGPIGFLNLAALPESYVFIHHGATESCKTKPECIKMVQNYQRYHMDSHGWSDIGYSFVVGEDGHVYEARGWNEIGAHTYGYNTKGIGICIIGDFTSHVPNDAALNAVRQLIQCGLDQGHIPKNYILKGHRDVGQTACPGDKLWALIHGWPHYREH